MPLSRRTFLAASAAATLIPGGTRASTALPALRAFVSDGQIAPEGYGRTGIWSFDGTAPGPLIRVPQGARLQRSLQNDLPQPTSVHWHGIRIDNAMDGVPGLTQEAVAPGARFDYDFVAPDAGTYWYHSHMQSMEQVERGLHGVLIVDEPQAPDVDDDLTLVLDDWLLDPDTGALVEGFDNPHDLSHDGRYGNLLTVNGRFDPAYPVRRHDRLRLRLVNVATARIFEIGLDGLDGWIVALDGMPLESPLPVTGSFSLSPAQRADLIVDVTAEQGADASLLSIERDGGYGLARFPVTGAASATRRDRPQPLPPNALPEIADIAKAPLFQMDMTGGAMMWLQDARHHGQDMDGRALAQQGMFWALAGVADRDATPFIDAARGQTLRIAFSNKTAFAHAMHLHGHHFRAIADDGTLGPWRDTLLVRESETRQIALVADNPGSWLLHCHMLAHAKSGMTSWIRVAA